MDLNLRQVRAFVAVARLGSFTRAAALLHVAQPTLTVQIVTIGGQSTAPVAVALVAESDSVMRDDATAARIVSRLNTAGPDALSPSG